MSCELINQIYQISDMQRRNVKHPSVSVRLRCEFVPQITLCTQGTASGTRCESSGQRHNARACIPGAAMPVKFRQRISGYAELPHRRGASTATGTGEPGDSFRRSPVSSRARVRNPKIFRSGDIFWTYGRPTTGRPYTGSVRPGNLQRRLFGFSSAQPSAEF